MAVEWALVGLIAGAASGILGFGMDQRDAWVQAEEQRKKLVGQKDRALKQLDLEFEIAQKNANKNANRSDTLSSINEQIASDDANNQLERLKLQQESETFAWNQQSMNNASAKGDALNNIGASGIRAGTSSISDAVDLQSALNDQQLQLAQDAQRKGNELQLADIIKNVRGNVSDIQFNRTDAQDLRDSFIEGGDQYRLYESNRKNTEANYNDALNAIEREQDDLEDFWKNALGGLTAAFSGGSKGYQAGATVQGYLNNNKSVNFDTSAQAVKRVNTMSGDAWNNITRYNASQSDYYRYGGHW